MDESVHLSMRHADGSMNALQKGEILDWLADPKSLQMKLELYLM